MRYNILTLSALLAIFSTALSAQDAAKPRREVGLQFNNIDFDGGTFSAFYKKQKKENVYRRVQFVAGALSLGILEEDFIFNFSAGIGIGREKRKPLDAKLECYQGPQFGLNFALYTTGDDDATGFLVRPSFGWVLGLQHSFNDRWAVNIETIPSVSIAANTTGDDRTEGLFFGAGFSNSVSLGLVRKF
jgi:opacity protein-like surface antigen